MVGELTQMHEVQVRQLERMLEAERRLRAMAEEQAGEARQALEGLARDFCAADLDELQRGHKVEVQGWSAAQLAKFIHQGLARRIRRSESGDRLDRLYEAAQVQIDELQRGLIDKTYTVEQQVDELCRLEGELAAAKADLAAARKRLAELPPLPPPAEVQDATDAVRVIQSPGAWFDEWQADTHHARSRDLLHQIGTTGICRRAVLLEQLSARWGVSSRGPGQESVDLCLRYELIEVVAPASGSPGRPPQLLHLSARGRDAFLLLFERDPVPSELDELLKRHKTPEHTALNLDAAEALQARLDAAVDLFPPLIRLDGGRQFAPDLVATLPNGEVIYVECERGTAPEGTVREHKWQNVYDATGGRFYVICADSGSRSKVVSEINCWAGMRPINVYATDLVTLGKRENAFWFYCRERLPGRQRGRD